MQEETRNEIAIILNKFIFLLEIKGRITPRGKSKKRLMIIPRESKEAIDQELLKKVGVIRSEKEMYWEVSFTLLKTPKKRITI